MTPALSVLLCLGLCLCKRTRTQAADGFPKPSLRAENGSVVPRGGAVTLRCRGSWEAVEWLLEKRGRSGWSLIKVVRQAGNEGQFSLPSVTPHDAGTYRCFYRHSSSWWSQLSDPLELVVTGLSAPPSLAALPGSEVAPGQNVTLQCRSELWYDWCVLCKDREEISRGRTRSHGWMYQTDFFFPAVNPTQDGTYRCFGFYSSSPSLWSSPSAPLLLRVSGTAKGPHLPQIPGNPPAVTSSPPRTSPSPRSENGPSGHSILQVSILVGISAFLILTFLFLSLLYFHRCRYQPSLGKGDRETDIKTTRSSELAGSTLEETVYAAVNDDRRTEEAGQEDTSAFQREAPQEVTYTQLDHKRLNRGAEPPPPSGPVEPSVYAALP
ncbi:leukocyte immunoglobulin-like receptor subfamily B member 3 [Monodelphis domestica]|uniref:leukocyte immunoglobulin-like receptor subfamily B member 3 n=1 Tax=Monodelphis domestica TaxID=13616 RepID=UPI0024E269A1|nr:leukocyte immunoglobulin-like receptor subfamily B member 3 [Monodelphis domestica]